MFWDKKRLNAEVTRNARNFIPVIVYRLKKFKEVRIAEENKE